MWQATNQPVRVYTGCRFWVYRILHELSTLGETYVCWLNKGTRERPVAHTLKREDTGDETPCRQQGDVKWDFTKGTLKKREYTKKWSRPILNACQLSIQRGGPKISVYGVTGSNSPTPPLYDRLPLSQKAEFSEFEPAMQCGEAEINFLRCNR